MFANSAAAYLYRARTGTARRACGARRGPDLDDSVLDPRCARSSIDLSAAGTVSAPSIVDTAHTYLYYALGGAPFATALASAAKDLHGPARSP